ncbi:hypothetical protein BDY19DRAFT_902611 [Irpex rosettiformis]|uniref:Uncharacterized protein n=1 Tax=Irpex rosettiformis TaxID=378272 RepID=A0ACB8UHI4_9APHY|nr:hypothetical protein BDY19DRAFT_902611 [Irpex rosettiformis]
MTTSATTSVTPAGKDKYAKKRILAITTDVLHLKHDTLHGPSHFMATLFAGRPRNKLDLFQSAQLKVKWAPANRQRSIAAVNSRDFRRWQTNCWTLATLTTRSASFNSRFPQAPANGFTVTSLEHGKVAPVIVHHNIQNPDVVVTATECQTQGRCTTQAILPDWPYDTLDPNQEDNLSTQCLYQWLGQQARWRRIHLQKGPPPSNMRKSTRAIYDSFRASVQ